MELIKSSASLLRERGQTVSFAESCTGGSLSSQFVALSGISDVYMGSVVAYSNFIKTEVLNVPAPLIASVGAVSHPVALFMARGVRHLTKSHWAVSITGIAGPNGGTRTKPVGTVCFGMIGPGFERAWSEHFKGDRLEVQKRSVEHIIKQLNQTIKGE